MPPNFSCYPISYHASHREETWELMVVADKPFALITIENEVREFCEMAKRVIEGKPKRLPRIRHPNFSRGAKGWRWVKLTDLADFMSLSADHVLERYGGVAVSEFNFLSPRKDAKLYGSLLVTLDSCLSKPLVMILPDNIHSALVPIEEWRDPDSTRGETLWVHDNCNRIFVPAGWAINVLCMQWFGYQNFDVFGGEEVNEALAEIAHVPDE